MTESLRRRIYSLCSACAKVNLTFVQINDEIDFISYAGLALLGPLSKPIRRAEFSRVEGRPSRNPR